MRAVRLGPEGIGVVDVAAPTGDGVRIKVRSAGVCGSDLHLADMGALTQTIGHEFAGVTTDGRAVAVEPLAPCDECDPCRRGDYNLCVLGGQMIFGIGLDGGMADEVIVPERAIVALPAGLDPADASLVEPMAVLVYTFRRAGVLPTDRVVVIGGGTIGLCAVAVARSLGCEVALVSRHDHQRAAGERLGAVGLSGEYDVAIEAAGSETALAQAVDITRPGGTVAIPGIYWGPTALPGLQMCLREVSLCPATLYGRHAGGRDADAAAALLAATPEFARAVITHRFPLDAAAEAFQTARDRSAGAIKVVLEP